MFRYHSLFSRTILVSATVSMVLAGVTTSASAQRSSQSPTATVAHTWLHAISISGTVNHNGYVTSISCPSAGNCAAAGDFRSPLGIFAPFIANQINGTWSAAVEVPGVSGFNAVAGSASSISCASTGNCTVAGTYVDTQGHDQVFVSTESNGVLSVSTQIPGLAVLNADGISAVEKLTCTSPGNCTLGGYYKDGSAQFQTFVSSQVHGTWTTAIALPGLVALNVDGHSYVESLSCATVGNCVIGGYYRDGSNNKQAYVATQTNGTWSNAIEVPGTNALNTGNSARVNSIACPAVAKCVLVGFYIDSLSRVQAFVDNEVNGAWAVAIEAPGIAALNPGGDASLQSIACPTIGNCSAGGYITDATSHSQAMVVKVTNGTWSNAQVLPGSVALDVNGAAAVSALACSVAGNCSATGLYLDGASQNQIFVANEINGVWKSAIELPGFSTIHTGGNTDVNDLSCAPDGGCSIGGYYFDGSARLQGFVASEVIGTNSSIPLAVHAFGANKIALVQWTAPTHTNGSPIFLYSVHSTSGAHTCTSVLLYCVVSGLSNSMSYRFTVTATNLSGNSARSAPSISVRPHA